MRYVRLTTVLSLIALIFLPSLFLIGCGDEGEKLVLDDANDDPNNPLPPVNPPENTPEEPEPPEENPPEEQPPEEPPVENPPEEPPEEPPPPPEPEVAFEQDILPILTANCAFPGCHGANPPSGLLLTTYADFQRGGNSGAAFIAGNGNGSLIVRRINGGGMPLGRPPLNQEQIQLIVDWIDDGAENN